MIASQVFARTATHFAAALMAIAGMGASGWAADVPVKAPAAVVIPSWSGFYIGSHAGGAWGLNGDASAVTITQVPFATDPVAFGRKSDFGVVTGVHAGFNWQTGSWLLGAEVDFSLASLRNEFNARPNSLGVPTPAGNFFLMHTDLNWLASARGRLGHTWGNSLLYVTGGAAWANITYSAVRHFAAIPPNNITSSSRTDAGWVAGGGGEYALSANWMLRAEYLYYHIKTSRSVTTTCAPAVGCGLTPPVIVYTWRPNEVHVARVGLSYKFQPVP
jgi:outer membrane immunogenic protein